MSDLRHMSIAGDAKASRAQVAENSRDANVALGERVRGYLVDVQNYCALGDSTARIGIPAKPQNREGAPVRPRAVLLVNAYESRDPSKSTNFSTYRHFYYTNGSLGVYEPDGMTADTFYHLTFLVLE